MLLAQGCETEWTELKDSAGRHFRKSFRKTNERQQSRRSNMESLGRLIRDETVQERQRLLFEVEF